jgi:hypothetical protein
MKKKKYIYIEDEELLKILPKRPKNSYNVFDKRVLITAGLFTGDFEFQNIKKFKDLIDNGDFKLFIINKQSFPNHFQLIAKQIKTDYEFELSTLMPYEDFILFKLDMIKYLPELKENIKKAAREFIIDNEIAFRYLTEEYVSSLVEMLEIKKKISTFK